MIKKLNTIKISRKVHTTLKFDLTNFVFPIGSKLIFTIKETEWTKELIKRQFTESLVYNVLITPEEANKLTNNEYKYDIVLELSDGVKLKQSLISDVVVEGVIYGTNNSN